MTAAPTALPVLVAGDANVDLVLRGDVVPRFGQAEQLVDSGELVVGGSASIVACGLARLDVPTALAARLGNDVLGRFMSEALNAAGVDTRSVAVDDAVPSGMSIILSAPEDRAILTVPGTIPMLRATDVLAAAARVRHVHVASYFLQPTLAAELPELFAELQSRDITTSLDTNWDPAEKWLGLAAVLPHVDYLFPNLEELRALAGDLGTAPGDNERSARSLAALGPRVVVKAGPDGGWSLSHNQALVRAAGLNVSVVDTTGAGDSFDAGYLAALSYGVDDEQERLRWATRAGSLSTRGAGGTGTQATLADLTQSAAPV
jgi:sugar/nucleoside kinase (ribokinase family)